MIVMFCCFASGTMLPSGRYTSGSRRAMTPDSLEARVAALEAKMGSKTIEEQFREQAELIDRLFSYRFEENDKKWDAKLHARFASFEKKLNVRLLGLENSLERRLDAKLENA
ncbi:MAG TPA: hypothetical protein VJM31_16210 [Vicinamibacterales bacterium]|nr:hypothetical protein [Vicinamibacterales bacterium]